MWIGWGTWLGERTAGVVLFIDGLIGGNEDRRTDRRAISYHLTFLPLQIYQMDFIFSHERNGKVSLECESSA